MTKIVNHGADWMKNWYKDVFLWHKDIFYFYSLEIETV